jgi:2-dehydropantoate 2-reductase
VASGCAQEAYDVARARGIALDIDDVVLYVREFGLKIPEARPSVLLDHMARRRSEIDVINGAVFAAARALDLAAPYNAVITALVKAREAEF